MSNKLTTAGKDAGKRSTDGFIARKMHLGSKAAGRHMKQLSPPFSRLFTIADELARFEHEEQLLGEHIDWGKGIYIMVCAISGNSFNAVPLVQPANAIGLTTWRSHTVPD